jgi:hypothetical protein
LINVDGVSSDLYAKGKTNVNVNVSFVVWTRVLHVSSYICAWLTFSWMIYHRLIHFPMMMIQTIAFSCGDASSSRPFGENETEYISTVTN